MNNKSFTLIEMLVVIVVIGVLSAFILVGMSSITSKASFAKGQAFLNSMDNSLLLGRVSQWKLDQVLGSSAPYTTSDTWGVNTGTLMDGTDNTCVFTGTLECPQPVTSGCPSGNCLSFDGTNDYVDCGSGSSLSISSTTTISFWFKSISGAATLISKAWNQWRFYSNPLNILNIRDGSNSGWSTNWVYQSNVWYNMAWVNTGAQEILYVNGVQYNSRSVSGVITATGLLKVGAYDAVGSYFYGLIDDVRVYNQAIPTSEIQQNYFLGLNNLYKNGGLTQIEYTQRLAELRNDLAQPKQ